MKKIEIFGCKVASITMKETLDEIEKIIKDRTLTQHVVINAGKVVLMEKDENLKKIVSDC